MIYKRNGEIPLCLELAYSGGYEHKVISIEGDLDSKAGYKDCRGAVLGFIEWNPKGDIVNNTVKKRC